MKISFSDVDNHSQNPYINVNGNTTSNSSSTVTRNVADRSFSLDISSKVTDNAYKGQGKTIKEVQISAESMDVDAYRDYMAVMSNCVSDEDFARMQKDGFNPSEMDFEDSVSIVDHIKAAVMKGGTEVVGYTDTISAKALEEITGSEVFARELKSAFGQKDIPLDENIAKDAYGAFNQQSEISSVSQTDAKYLIENDLVPSISNLYTAAFSSGKAQLQETRGYYSDSNGYLSKKAQNNEIVNLEPQMKAIIKEAGFEVNEKTLEDSSSIIRMGMPLTVSNFEKFEEISSLKMPLNVKEFVSLAARAVEDGVAIKDYSLLRKKSMRQEAVDIFNEVNTLGTIKGRRVLEEVRLSMSVEANLKLLRSGVSIDTAPMEDLVKNLKEIEKEFAINLSGDDDEIEAVRKKDIFEETLNLTDIIRTAPISISYEYEASDSLVEVSDKALSLSRAKAAQSYEPLMTSVRGDLGDSIQKAFRNADELLEEMDVPLTDENRRAVRILGYNSMEINDSNLQMIKDKDRLLCDTIENMTPGRVLGMIRNNVNPTLMSVSELNEYLSTLDTAGEDILSYSKFLYKLEKDNEITPEEKESYIGIYRLVNQLEKTDHKAIGAIEKAGYEFNFENMLSALRSTKKRMDYRVDDNFGGVDVIDKGIASITSQIAKGFVADTSDLKEVLGYIGEKKAQEEFEEQQNKEIRDSFKTETEVIEELKNMKLPVSAENIISMTSVIKDGTSVFRRLKQSGYKKEGRINLNSEKEAKESYKEYTADVKSFIEEKVFSDDEAARALNSMDIKLLADMYHFSDFLERRSAQENYEIPVDINGEVVAVNLKVVHKKDEASAEISFEAQRYGKVRGYITPSDKGLSGNYTCTSPEGLKLLDSRKDELKEVLDRIADTDVISTDKLYKAAKAFIEFVTA